jgi:restriction system protein
MSPKPDEVRCECGALIEGEPPIPEDPVQRKPCPECGSTSRQQGMSARLQASTSFTAVAYEQQPAVLVLSGILIDEAKVSDGRLIKATSLVWDEIVRVLGNDWSQAFNIPWDKWEEIIAGAFKRDEAFKEVILTRRSGDYGRDIIAFTKEGMAAVKILGSVKAYKQGHLVTANDVRSLMGVVNAEQKASKGILMTTSDFASKIRSDPTIKPYLPTRLQLVNGMELREWLTKLHEGKK